MQPHGHRTQKQSPAQQDGTVEAGSRQIDVVNGTNDASVKQPVVSAGASPPATLVAAAGPASVPQPPFTSSVAGSSSLSDPFPVLRCGVIGSGRSASRLISLLSVTRGCRVVSILSKNDSRSAALRRQHPTITMVQSDLSAFLSLSDIDAVFIASSVGSVTYGSHCELALACAESRKPTVVDRPFARSASEAREMQIAFERAQVPLLAHQPLRAMPAISTLHHSIAALQRVTSISYSFSSPLSSLTASSPSPTSSSTSPCLPSLPRSLASNGGPTLPFVCDLFDVLECVLGAVSDVSGDAVHHPSPPQPAPPASSDSSPALCESVLTCSFRCGGALGAAVWDVAAVAHDDRLVLRGVGGDLTLSLYQSTMPILQTAAGIQQISEPHSSALSSSAVDPASSEAVQRLVDELRRRTTAAKSKSTGSTDRDKASLRADRSISSGVHSGAGDGSGSSSSSGSSSGQGESAAVDVCLVTGAMAVRSLACADAALRTFYRLRTDAYWDRPHTWQSHAFSIPTRPAGSA